MKMGGMAGAAGRQDIIAYLEQLASGAAAAQTPTSDQESDRNGGMMGMMGASEPADISQPSPSQRVVSLQYCRDTYEVTTADGERRKFWEFNLRFKTDSSDLGPPEGKPVMLPAGMQGDRAFVIFHGPEAISGFVAEKC
jgi:cytochrome c